MKISDKHWKWIAGILLICLAPSIVYAAMTGAVAFANCTAKPSTVTNPDTKIPWEVRTVVHCQNCTEYECKQNNSGRNEEIALKRCVESSDALCILRFGGNKDQTIVDVERSNPE